MRSSSIRVEQSRRPLVARDAFTIIIPTLIGVLWAFIAVDLTFVLEIDWFSTPHGIIAIIAYAIQLVLFWPAALFVVAARALPLIGWQPGWFGLSLITAACGGFPGFIVGLMAFSWSRR